MKLCIAEKPSVARDLANVLGAGKRMDGYFEGNGYQVTWTFGHFCELKTPDDYDPAFKRWSLHTLPVLPPKFEIKLKKDKGIKKQFGIIKKLLKNASLIINCGDAGQEGELIQRWVLQHAKNRKPVKRLWISSLTTQAIRQGFANLHDAAHYDRLYYAGMSRAVGDWLLGMNATRLFTLKYGGYKQVLSIGRVQTPTLALMVERHKTINNFVPEPFWELKTRYREVVFSSPKGKFFKKPEAEQLLQQAKGKPFLIEGIETKKSRESPPQLFDLTALQIHANKRFGMSADQTLKTVQKLYEKKLVTYPRVDTAYLPSDMYPKIGGVLEKLSDFEEFTKPLLQKSIRKTKRVFNDAKITDHHAIIPTNANARSLPDAEYKIYNAIARRFVAAFHDDCLLLLTTVKGSAGGVSFVAKGKQITHPGWRVLYPKRKKQQTDKPAKPNEKGAKKGAEEAQILPEFKKGESGPHQPFLDEKQTQPPKPFTEATLLKAMETAGKKVDDEKLRELMKANGIGRPSTRAAIIETLFRRKYIQRQRKSLQPTPVGIQLIDLIQNPLLKSAELTGQWERKLRQIESGEYDAATFIGEMKNMVAQLCNELKAQTGNQKIIADDNTGFAKKKTFKNRKKGATSGGGFGKRKNTTPNPKGKNDGLEHITCPKCNKGNMLKGKSAYGCSQWQTGCTFRLPFVLWNKAISENQCARLLTKSSTIKLKGFTVNGKKIAAYIKLNPSGNIYLQAADDESFKLTLDGGSDSGISKKAARKTVKKNNLETLKCSKCGLGNILKGKTAYGCSRWREGCDFKLPFSVIFERAGNKKVSKKLVEQLIKEYAKA